MIIKIILFIIGVNSILFAESRKYSGRIQAAPKLIIPQSRECEDEGLLTDCSGNCFEQQFLSWIGDGNCDGINEIQGLNFYCEDWNFDGGDCEGDCPGQGMNTDCDGECFHDAFLVLLGDGDCNQDADQYDFNCHAWNFDNGDCDPANMDPEVGHVCQGCNTESCLYDCALNCVDASLAISWLSDGYCDDGQWDIVLDCEYFDFDGGDCSLVPCDDGEIHDCSNNCFLPELIEDGECHNGYETDENFNCLAFNFDGNDCGYGDCSGHLFESSLDGYVGNGECDSGENDLNLNCESFGYDGGDCPTGPDLMVDLDYLLNTIYEDEIFVEEGDCYIEEACVSGSGLRRVIRFGTLIINVGNEDFIIGEPGGESWNWDECHQHYHYNDYAHYQLVDFENQGEYSIGFKNGWCVMDLVPYLAGSECTGYDCEFQGISSGCADIYGSFLDCQWIDITDVPSGIYQFEVETNPYQNFNELDFENNIVSILIEITENDFTVLPTDCNGDMDGTAFYDECHICSGGNTNITPNTDMDCNGDCFGTAIYDDCGECSGGYSGHAYNSGMDCMGDCAPDSPAGCEDITGNGQCGNAIPDICGECVYGNSDMPPGWALDCAFNCHGDAYEDECGICDDIPENDNEAMDCNNMCFGSAVEDICGECNGDGWACTELGDINQDLSINVVDVVYVVNVILGYQYLMANQTPIADLNSDMAINIADVVLIIDIILESTQSETIDLPAIKIK